MLGGIGSCGRVLCCVSFLGEFEPVSIRMAKAQNLSLNPSKISGICGRLMCCLKYELNPVTSAEEEMPELGDRVTTPKGSGKVISLDPETRSIRVQLDNGGHTSVAAG